VLSYMVIRKEKKKKKRKEYKRGRDHGCSGSN
jgi:hypothetical protein